jgi:hypothetical protein
MRRCLSPGSGMAGVCRVQGRVAFLKRLLRRHLCRKSLLGPYTTLHGYIAQLKYLGIVGELEKRRATDVTWVYRMGGDQWA